MANQKRYYWLKLKEDFFGSPRIMKLRKIAGGDTYTIIYLKMQLMSVKNGGIIEFSGIEDTFEEELALILQEDIENVTIVISYLKALGMIEFDGDRSYLLPEAASSIGSEGESASRKREFDKKKKQLALQSNAKVTNGNVSSVSISPSKSNNKEKEVSKVFEDYCDGDTELLDALKSYDEMRDKTKKPMSDRARKILCNRLDTLAKNNTKMKIDMLDESILHNWLSVYEPKKEEADKYDPYGPVVC